jgi:hypothetical protein
MAHTGMEVLFHVLSLEGDGAANHAIKVVAFCRYHAKPRLENADRRKEDTSHFAVFWPLVLERTVLNVQPSVYV